MKNMLKVNNSVNTTAVVATRNDSFIADEFEIRSALVVYTSTTAAFSIKLQYSNDNTTWTDFTTATAVSNASGSIDYQVLGTKDALYWRVNCARTSGTLDTYKIYFAYKNRP